MPQAQPSISSFTAQDLSTSLPADIPLDGFIINLLTAAILGMALGWFFVRFATVFSNRKTLGWNLVLITMTTMVIITIVKSSLALSLGLVGALSIVRFRTAIKEPEELAYLFIAISIGLGLGADQRLLTVISFAGIMGVIILRRAVTRADDGQNLILTVGGDAGQTDLIDRVVDTLNESCEAVSLKRFDERGDGFEAAFLVDYRAFEQLKDCRKRLRALHESVDVTFIDNRGLI